MRPDPRRRPTVLALCALAFLAAGALCPFVGPTPLHWGNVFLPGPQGSLDADILFEIRLPRVAMALLSGASLSVAGAVFQALLRNPLADPFTLGLAGGSSFGAVIALLFFPAFAAIPGAVPAAAFLGALFSMTAVYSLSRLFHPRLGADGSQLHPMALLLSGISVNYFFSAVLMVSYYLVDFTRSLSLLRWILGGLDTSSLEQLLPAGCPALMALVPLMLLAPSLNLLSAGREVAASKGADTKRLHVAVFLWGSLLTASVTAFTGPIGFVGLMVPNFLRRWIGYDHRWLLPSSALLGGAFLALADTLARTVFAPAELPVGALTALLGGPLFLLILLRPRRWTSMEG